MSEVKKWVKGYWRKKCDGCQYWDWASRFCTKIDKEIKGYELQDCPLPDKSELEVLKEWIKDFIYDKKALSQSIDLFDFSLGIDFVREKLLAKIKELEGK